MPAGTKAHQLVEVCQVGAALIILAFKPRQIDQQLSWSWLTCIGGNRHVSPPLTVPTLSAAHRNCLASLARGNIEFGGARSKMATANPRRRAGQCRTDRRAAYTRSAHRAMPLERRHL